MKKENIIIIAIALIVIYFLWFKKKSKYYRFFQSLGFGTVLLDQFNNQELKDSYDYINNYTRKGIELTKSRDAEFYNRIKAINDKFHIFNIN